MPRFSPPPSRLAHRTWSRATGGISAPTLESVSAACWCCRRATILAAEQHAAVAAPSGRPPAVAARHPSPAQHLIALRAQGRSCPWPRLYYHDRIEVIRHHEPDAHDHGQASRDPCGEAPADGEEARPHPVRRGTRGARSIPRPELGRWRQLGSRSRPRSCGIRQGPARPVHEPAAAVKTLLARYRDVPMDLAEACLVRLSEIHADCVLVTAGSDFRDVYRRYGRRATPTMMPSGVWRRSRR